MLTCYLWYNSPKGGDTVIDNSVLLEYVKDITVAKLQSWPHAANDQNGKDVAKFMQNVYDKLSELNEQKTK